MGKLYAIPDIHGRYDLLNRLWGILLDEHKLNLTEDKVVFLGDMIDRGPDSKLVLDFIRKLTEASPNVIALGGNHEWLCIDAYLHGKEQYDHWYLWMMNGGTATLRSFPGDIVPEEYRRWMAGLPLFHEEPGFFFSHAPLPTEELRRPYNKGEKFSKEELIWTYDPDEKNSSRNLGDKIGVCGHIHQLRKGIKEPRFYDHYIFADAGCGCNDSAPLVAIDVRSREVIYARS